jgi:hypothetical protein
LTRSCNAAARNLQLKASDTPASTLDSDARAGVDGVSHRVEATHLLVAKGAHRRAVDGVAR